MLDSKFFFTLVGLIVAVFAICKTNMSPSINEGYWSNSGAPRTVKVVREVHHKGGANPYPLQNNYQAMLGSEKFVSRPSFQGLLSPRFSNVDYGANIRYNMPSYKHQGSPCSPLDMGNMVKEDYGCSGGSCGGGCSSGCGVAKCGKGGVPLDLPSKSKALSEEPDYVKAMNSVYDSHAAPVGVSTLAVGDMTTIGADGNVTQPVVYDRYIYANQKSRLRALGDPIRGDLAIVPCNNGWFNPAVNPNIDLHEGAMNVLGGVSNSTANALAELQFATSGGAEQISGGVDMSNDFSTSLGAGMADVNVTAFP